VRHPGWGGGAPSSWARMPATGMEGGAAAGRRSQERQGRRPLWEGAPSGSGHEREKGIFFLFNLDTADVREAWEPDLNPVDRVGPISCVRKGDARG
jgi:hypothetical protein